jgi:hypothetical protein
MAVDFRRELSRALLAECEWRNDPVNAEVMSHFVRKLKDVNCNMGMIFSKKALTCEGQLRGAALVRENSMQEKGIPP